ncbi:MAG: hypothetical protein IJB83_02240 [Bacilli bacterium]|nr:hypothetical protein [Bacilli bacterium]
MSNEETIRIYYPVVEKETTSNLSDLILLSKENEAGSHYFSFNINTFKFKKIDNLMGYLLNNKIHSLRSTESNQKIIDNIEIALKKHGDEESQNDFELFKNTNTKTLQNQKI